MDTDAWKRLAKKTRHGAFFSIGDPVIRSSPTGLEILESRIRFLNITFGFCVFSAFLLFALFVVEGRHFTAVFFKYTFGAIGFFGLLFMIAALFQIRRISLDLPRNLIQIQMRSFFKTHSYELDTRDVSVQLVGREDKRLHGRVHRGRTVLILSTDVLPNTVIKLAVAESKPSVEGVYRLLSERVGNKSTDRTLETVISEGDEEFQIPRTAHGEGNGIYGGRLRFESPNRISLRPSIPMLMLILLGGFLAGVFGFFAALHGFTMVGGVGEKSLFILIGGVLGTLFTLAAFLLLWTQVQSSFSADRGSRTITLRTWNNKLKCDERSILFDNILGIQILLFFAEGGGDSMGDTECEMNLVLRNPKGARIKLMHDNRIESVHAKAVQLSEFLGCRLFDHRDKGGLS